MPVVHTTAARRDLLEIWRYLAREASPEIADAQLRRFQKTARGLADMPFSAQPRPDLGPDIRSRRVGSYMLYYRPVPHGIEVVRVLHGHRDVQPEMMH